jgi:hypothetical protein
MELASAENVHHALQIDEQPNYDGPRIGSCHGFRLLVGSKACELCSNNTGCFVRHEEQQCALSLRVSLTGRDMQSRYKASSSIPQLFVPTWCPKALTICDDLLERVFLAHRPLQEHISQMERVQRI